MSSTRFTIDGSDALEGRLTEVGKRILEGVQSCVAKGSLEALVLAGGYGRGEGGVIKTAYGDAPYNDMELYVFLRGNRLLNEMRFGKRLHTLGDELSPLASVTVEFKIDSLHELRRRPVSMFSYDLVAKHRRLHGPDPVFVGCERHADPRNIPSSEATRLLLNRCTGLLLAKEILVRETQANRAVGPSPNPGSNIPASELTAEEADFVGRNLAKAQLALGDAFLASSGQYHWSCLERHDRLRRKSAPAQLPWLGRVQELHAEGVKFKLHPSVRHNSREGLCRNFDELTGLAQDVWLWLERNRLNRPFVTAREYALDKVRKSRECAMWRNCLLNLKHFGLKAVLTAHPGRYPRERLLNTLPLLLWDTELTREPGVMRYLQKQIATQASEWRGMVAAYKQIWPQFR